MPMYEYRREDGTTFEIRQKFSDDPLEVDPKTGQKVQRIIQAAGIMFKGSGFYVTDNSNASRKATTAPTETGSSDNGSSDKGSSDKGSTTPESPTTTPATTAKETTTKGSEAAD